LQTSILKILEQISKSLSLNKVFEEQGQWLVEGEGYEMFVCKK
jgi:hypothetical protein